MPRAAESRKIGESEKKLKQTAEVLPPNPLAAAVPSLHPSIHPPNPRRRRSAAPQSPPMATAAGPVGGLPAKDEITEVEMEIMEPPEEAAERAGMKRAWGSANASGSHGFVGVTTAEKKPTLLPHNNVKYLKKAGNGNLLHPDIDGAHKTGGLYLHDTHRSPTLPYSNASSQPEVNWIQGSIKFCIFKVARY